MRRWIIRIVEKKNELRAASRFHHLLSFPHKENVIGQNGRPAGALDEGGDLAAVVGAVGEDVGEHIVCIVGEGFAFGVGVGDAGLDSPSRAR